MMKSRYDVIIVGTGVAGCFAALHLPEDRKILMITKADLEESNSFLAQGGICVLKNEQDYESFFEDTMRAGHYENRPESVDIMIRSSRGVIEELVKYGAEFAEKDGKFCYTREGAHSTDRILYHGDTTGKEITSVLLSHVKKRRNITICTHVTMMDILCRDNTCCGIVAKTPDGIITPVFAGDVIWASGGIGGIYENSTNFRHITGDALGIALKHGIRLKNIDYVQIHPTTLYSEKPGRRFLISESVRGEGAVLYDKSGNRFADELMPRDLLSEAIFRQMKKDGTPYVWLSMMTVREKNLESRFPEIVRHCREEGYDVMKQCIPVVPSQHYFMGGVDVDTMSRTSMDHLYAAGETSCNGVHGANRLASNSLLESLIFAKRAAQDIAERGKREKMPDSGWMAVLPDQLRRLRESNLCDSRGGLYLSGETADLLTRNFGVRVEEYYDEKKCFSESKDRIFRYMEKERERRRQS